MLPTESAAAFAVVAETVPPTTRADRSAAEAPMRVARGGNLMPPMMTRVDVGMSTTKLKIFL
jgi:hypothetical protein